MNLAELYMVHYMSRSYNFRCGLYLREDLPRSLSEAVHVPREWCIHWDYCLDGIPFSIGRQLNNADLELMIGLNFRAYERMLHTQNIPFRVDVPSFSQFTVYVFPDERSALRGVSTIVSGISWARLQLARETEAGL